MVNRAFSGRGLDRQRGMDGERQRDVVRGRERQRGRAEREKEIDRERGTKLGGGGLREIILIKNNAM